MLLVTIIIIQYLYSAVKS